jgi:methanogenic corrinoid protein MtbC1
MTDRFITEVLCRVQAHVGTLWQTNVRSEADEHAVTSVVEEVVGALSARTDVVAPSRGRVLVACVEGEHHSMPARLGVERLRLRGWAVTFLGGSLPPQTVVDFAVKAEPDMVVLSCTRSLLLPAARRGIGAGAEVGIPVVAAGAGFGRTQAWSDRLGASGWIGPTGDPAAVLEGRLPPARAVGGSEVAAELEHHIEDLSVGALGEMYVHTPAFTSLDIARIASITEDLRDIWRYVGVSLELDDPSILGDYLGWLTDTLSSRHVQPDVLDATLEITAAVTSRTGFDQPAALLRNARTLPVTAP